MNYRQVMEEPSTEAQLLSRNGFVLMCLQVLLDNADRAVNDIKAVINRKRNDISKKQESVQLKLNVFFELAMWLQGRLRRNKYYTAYDKRVEPVKAKFAAAALDFNNFDLKFKAAEKQLADMELAISNDRDRVSAIELANVSFETLEAEVGQVKKIVPKATEMKEIFVLLQFEWIFLNPKLDSDLDDCISKFNALKLEMYIKYGVMHN